MATVKKIKKNKKQWFKLENPVKIFTDDGIKECSRFYFNGFEPTFELVFSDGNAYKFTENHRIKNNEKVWVHVRDIELCFVSNNNLKLVSKKYIGVLPTMDMEVPDVHYYVLSNGIHSHNSAFILGQASEGIEPHRTNYCIKDLQKGKFTMRNPQLQEFLASKGYDTQEVWDSIAKNSGSVQHLDFLTDHEKNVFKTFIEIAPLEIIIQSAQRQKFIDQSQSLNLLIDPKVPVKEMNALYIEAWKLGVKSLYYQISVNAAQQLTRLLQCKSCEG